MLQAFAGPVPKIRCFETSKNSIGFQVFYTGNIKDHAYNSSEVSFSHIFGRAEASIADRNSRPATRHWNRGLPPTLLDLLTR